eukprot:m.17335 g.17335  ORF g.17335 m.17335 type:complete len:162 (-) comp3489_c0_seq1:122-607(-)
MSEATEGAAAADTASAPSDTTGSGHTGVGHVNINTSTVAAGVDGPDATGGDETARTTKKRPESVIVKLKAAANAPVLVEKRRKVKLLASQPLTRVTQHVEQLLHEKLQGGSRIYLYVSSAKSNFSPSPDQSVGNLYMCFGRETGKGSAILELTYTVTPSWG